MIKAVFFDAIDTLFGVYPDKISFYQKIIKEHANLAVSRDEMTTVWNKVFCETENRAQNEVCTDESNLAWENFNETILKELDFRGDISAVAKKLHYDSWLNPKSFHLYPDVLETLQTLKEENFFVGCVSNEDRELYKFFTHFGISEYFDFILVSAEAGYEKPHPEIFEMAITKSGFKPNEILFVGDSLLSDYNGSKNVGINPVLLDRNNVVSDNNLVTINNLNKLFEIIEGANNARAIT